MVSGRPWSASGSQPMPMPLSVAQPAGREMLPLETVPFDGVVVPVLDGAEALPAAVELAALLDAALPLPYVSAESESESVSDVPLPEEEVLVAAAYEPVPVPLL